MNQKKKIYQRDITLVFGKTGMGKTQWARQYLKTIDRVLVLDPLEEYHECVFYDDLSDLIDHCNKYKIFRCGYNNLTDFPLLCRITKTIPETTLVIEEAQRVLPPRKLLDENFTELIYRGRHYGSGLLMVAQRASTVDIAVRSQFTRLITFRQSESKDVDWICDCSGFDLADEILGLEPLEYFEISPSSYEKKKLEKILK
jgi:hypothetical protein